MSTFIAFLCLASGFPAVATVVAVVDAQPAFADRPTACHADTSLPDPRTTHYTHGSPHTGLVSREGYYYIEVNFGHGCGLGKDGLLHVIAHVHALEVLPKVGDLKDGYVPDDSHHAIYWLEFHGYADIGKEYSLPGSSSETASPYVSTSDHLDTCYPNGSQEKEICQDGAGTHLLTLRYDGPDVFDLSKGSDVRFRIANESGLIITDFAQMDIVACSTCTAPIVG